MQPRMKISQWIQSAIACAIFCGIFAASATAFAQETLTAHTVVTATTKGNEATPTIPQDSVKVELGRKPQEVSGWVPLRGSRAGLQLVLLMDDSSRSSLSLQLNDIKNFIQGLPPSTQIAIGYMRYGNANLVQGFTSDREAAINALRMPISSPGISASPYFCLSDLVKRWPMGSDVRREVIMVTDGVDRYSGRRYDPEDPYVQAALSDAQKAGVIVYSIYYKGAGRLDRSGFVTDGGQNYLIQVSQATGGEAYYQGFGNPVSFAPFLSDIQRKLENQYELSFSAPPKKGLQQLQVKTNQPNTKLAAPSMIPVGGSASER
jgi:VWFA-related protein